MLKRIGFVIALTLVVVIFTFAPQQPTLAADMTAGDAASLVSAINAANAAPGADTILITSDITLTTPAESSGTYGDTGMPAITSDITIEGQGFVIWRDGNGVKFRLLRVATGGSLTLINVIVRQGEATAGTVCSGAPCGGGAYNDGTITMLGSGLYANLVYATGSDYSAGGGGVYNNGSLILTDSTISSNSVYPQGGIGAGGGIYNNGSVTLTDSVLSSNQANDLIGGGIYNNTSATLTIKNTTIGTSFASEGSGIYNNGGTVTIDRSAVQGNFTTATRNGGGIANVAGTVTISNSSISHNNAILGGGIYNIAPAVLNVSYSTFSTNSADSGTGIYNTGTATIDNTLISGNITSIACDNSGTFNSTFSQADDATCPGFATFSQSAINLSAFYDQGGATNSSGPTPPSSAIDNGDNTICSAAPINSLDQRGVKRAAAACDIGSYEFVTNSHIRTLQFAHDSSLILGSTFPVTLTLDAPLETGYAPITAYISISGGSAVAGVDYEPFGLQTVTFNPGDTTKTVTLNMLNAPITADRTIILSFTVNRGQGFNGPGYSGPVKLGAQKTHTATLRYAAPATTPEPNFYMTDTPVLTWNVIPNVTGYEIQVSSSATFAPPDAFPAVTVSASTLSLQTPSLANGMYYWHVRTLNGSTVGAWSATQSFEVANQ